MRKRLFSTHAHVSVLLGLALCLCLCHSAQARTFNFAAKARAPAGAEPAVAREEAYAAAARAAMDKAVSILKKNFHIRRTGVGDDELAAILAHHFPATRERAVAVGSGQSEIVATASLPVDLDHLVEAINLYRSTGQIDPPVEGLAEDVSPPTGPAPDQEPGRSSAQTPAPPVTTLGPASAGAGGLPALTPRLQERDLQEREGRESDTAYSAGMDLDAPVGGQAQKLDTPARSVARQKPVARQSSEELMQNTARLWDGAAYSDPETALIYATRASVRSPGSAVPHVNRGAALHDLGRYQEAVEAYSRAIQIDPGYQQAYNNRGFTRHFMGDYQGAVEDYTRALEMAPGYTQAYVNRGFASRMLGDAAAMCRDYQRACEQGSCGVMESARQAGLCP